MTSTRTTVTQVEALGGRAVRVTFGDGAVHEVDLATLFAAGGAFARLQGDRSAFEAVSVNPEFGTVEWPGGIDLDPDVLRGDREPASGAALPRRIIQSA